VVHVFRYLCLTTVYNQGNHWKQFLLRKLSLKAVTATYVHAVLVHFVITFSVLKFQPQKLHTISINVHILCLIKPCIDKHCKIIVQFFALVCSRDEMTQG